MKVPLAHNDFGPDEGEQKANEKKRTLRKMGTLEPVAKPPTGTCR